LSQCPAMLLPMTPVPMNPSIGLRILVAFYIDTLVNQLLLSSDL